jgi:hypothetical protein
MREIKFKAWDKVEKKMVCVSNLSFWVDKSGQKSGLDIGVSYDDGDPIYGGETEYQLMQHTGLKDKNGKEIYEGDLIRTDGFSDGCSEPVVWRDCMFQIGEHGISPLYPRKDYEVIGNIYEMPEQLKQRGSK